jgi:hypothetical protein
MLKVTQPRWSPTLRRSTRRPRAAFSPAMGQI